MAERFEAYDFSLFETRDGSAVRAPRRERREAPARRNNVVVLPQRELEKNARPKRHPVRAMALTLVFAVFMSLAAAMVFSQQQLALLTEEINSATQTLEEGRSLEVQLSMRAAQKMNSAQVEDYAVNTLGMSKINMGQTVYVNVARQDRGTVLQSAEGGSAVDNFLARLRALFS